MTKSAKRLTTRIDLMLPGYGRFQRRSGATTLAEHDARKALVKRMAQLGLLDEVRALDEGRISWEYCRNEERHGRLGRATLADDFKLTRPLADALTETLPAMAIKAQSRDRYKLAFDQLREHAALRPTATVAELRTLDWRGVWTSMADLSTASRNRVRSAVSAFLTVYLGDKWHPERRAVIVAMGKKEKEPALPKDLTLDEFWTNHAALAPEFQPIAVTLVVGGMRVGEYLQCTLPSVRRLTTHNYLLVPDTKGGVPQEVTIDPQWHDDVLAAIPCRVADIPPVGTATNHDPRYHRIYGAFQKAAKATGIPWSPHYLRHVFAAEATDQFSTVQVKGAIRHKTTAMVERYAARKNNQQVARAVGERLAASRPAPLTLVRDTADDFTA